MTSPKRQVWVYSVLVIIALACAFFFREPLEKWFFLKSDAAQATENQAGSAAHSHDHMHMAGMAGMNMGGKTADDHDHMDHDHMHMDHDHAAPAPAIENYQFPPEIFSKLKDIFADTEKIQLALSQDKTDSIGADAEKIASATSSITDAKAPKTALDAIAEVSKNAMVLTGATSPETARPPYSLLSKALFTLAEVDPRLGEGWNTFRCPMAKGFQKWFQKGDKVQNPYMGQKMLSCGTTTNWVTAPKPKEPAPAAGDIAYYTCPMHPSVREHKPGQCPICHMTLTPVTKSSLQTGDVIVDSLRRERIGVKMEVVGEQPLTKQIRAVGEVAWDESEVYDVTARVNGWIEDLRVTREGDPVKKGEVLLRFYSPDMLATQRELINAPSDSRLANAAEERLRLWGMSSWEIGQIVKSRTVHEKTPILSPATGVVIAKKVNQGAGVSAGALLFRIANPAKLWVLADVFEQDLPFVKTGQKVDVSLPYLPNQKIQGTVDYIYPTLQGGNRTAKVRVEVDNKQDLLRPGMLANVEFDLQLGNQISVPEDSVIFTGPRRIVFVDQGEDRLRPIEVEVGPRADGRIVITKGLKKGDRVVTSGVFLLAAESRIRSAAKIWEANDGTN